MADKFADAKVVIRGANSKKNRLCNGQTKMVKRQTTIYKTLHSKVKFE